MKRRYTCPDCTNTVEIKPADVAPGVIVWPDLKCVGGVEFDDVTIPRHPEATMISTPVLEEVGR
jgi:hypothetical protein